MADFRKWLLTFALAALVIGTAGSANAQVLTGAAFGCATNAGVPPLVRAEGITELVGDVVLNCTGGTPTAVGAPVPQVNFQIFLNTNVTSRLQADPWSEALLTIDDPTPQAIGGAGTGNQATCTGTPCGLVGVANPTGINYAVPGAASNGGQSVRNVYQGRHVNPNSIVWLGVPVDPPGTTATRIIRITNVRANANQLGVSSTLIPTQIVMFISATSSTSIPINNPQQTVAFVQVGLIDFAVRKPDDSDSFTASFLQCVNNNKDLSTDNTKAYNTPGGRTALIRFREGFASSFKRRNVNRGTFPYDSSSIPVADQNLLGSIYNTETGFLNQNFTTTNGLSGAGLADQGTRLMARFNNIPNGVAIYVSNHNVAGTSTLAVRRTNTDANGAGSFSPVTATSSAETFGGVNTIAPVTISGGSGQAVWEVMDSDPLAVETLRVALAVAYTANTANNLPGLGTATVNGSFAPLSTVTTASASAPVPRFADTSVSRNLFIINACTTNLLWPFVSNQAGFDTGLVISNTSLDTGKTWGPTPPQAGACKICYYGGTTGGGAAPASQTTQVLAAGEQAIWTLSSGGNKGIAATPGFQGYIIAQCAFQYAHGYAFISDVGAQRLAMGYLALVLDGGIPSRTGFLSEVLGH